MPDKFVPFTPKQTAEYKAAMDPVGAAIPSNQYNDFSHAPSFLQHPLNGLNPVESVASSSGSEPVANVNSLAPGAIGIGRPHLYSMGIRAHELTHVFQMSRDRDWQKSLPADPSNSSPYEYGGMAALPEARLAGKTITNFGPEQQAEMVANYTEKHEFYMNKAKQGTLTPDDVRAFDALKSAYHPFIKQLAAVPAEGARQSGIDTRPTPPGIPSALISGIVQPDDLIGGEDARYGAKKLPDKVVHVPGKGLMSFPGDMPNQHIGEAIQNHLQAQGVAALNQAPAPIQRLTSNLGVNFVPSSGPEVTAADHSASMNAGVQVGNPNTIEIANQRLFGNPALAPQLAAHEAMHLIQNNLPPTMQSKIPQDNSTNPYNYGGVAGLMAARKAGKTMLDLPREQQGALVQTYQAKQQQYANAVKNNAMTPALHQDMQQFNAAHAPFISDIDKMPQSVIQMTAPGQSGINTTPRAPLPPPNWMTGSR